MIPGIEGLRLIVCGGVRLQWTTRMERYGLGLNDAEDIAALRRCFGRCEKEAVMTGDNQTADEWSVNGRTLQATCGRIEVLCGCDQERLLRPPVYQLTGTTGYMPPPLQRLIDAVLSDWNAGLSR